MRNLLSMIDSTLATINRQNFGSKCIHNFSPIQPMLQETTTGHSGDIPSYELDEIWKLTIPLPLNEQRFLTSMLIFPLLQAILILHSIVTPTLWHFLNLRKKLKIILYHIKNEQMYHKSYTSTHASSTPNAVHCIWLSPWNKPYVEHTR